MRVITYLILHLNDRYVSFLLLIMHARLRPLSLNFSSPSGEYHFGQGPSGSILIIMNVIISRGLDTGCFFTYLVSNNNDIFRSFRIIIALPTHLAKNGNNF